MRNLNLVMVSIFIIFITSIWAPDYRIVDTGQAKNSAVIYPIFITSSIMDVHGAGGQRSDPKIWCAEDFLTFHGPQGDVRYVYNFVKFVRDIK